MDIKKLKTIFFSTFKLSACTFGGGFVIVPLLRKKFVEELGWVEEAEMLDLTAIAQSSPGPIAVNAAILIGFRVAGLPGAFIAALGTSLPPLIIISIISLFYKAFRDNRYVSLAMKGMLAAVAAVLLDVVLRMTGNLAKKKRILYFVILAASFIANRYLKVNVVLIILACGLIGAIDMFVQNKKKAGTEKGNSTDSKEKGADKS